MIHYNINIRSILLPTINTLEIIIQQLCHNVLYIFYPVTTTQFDNASILECIILHLRRTGRTCRDRWYRTYNCNCELCLKYVN